MNAAPCCVNWAAGTCCFADPRQGCPHLERGVEKLAAAIDREGLSEGTASAQRINAAPIAHRCDFGGICNREHGAQCAEVCRRQRGEV